VFSFFSNNPDTIDALTQLLLTVVAAVWTAFKGSDLWERSKQSKVDKALLALEAGVQTSYEVYVRECKLANEDGKLTTQERANARQRAIDAAKLYASKEGINLVETLGADYITMLVERVVRTNKADAAIGDVNA